MLPKIKLQSLQLAVAGVFIDNLQSGITFTKHMFLKAQWRLHKVHYNHNMLLRMPYTLKQNSQRFS